MSEQSKIDAERTAFEGHYQRFDLSRDPLSGAYFDSEVRCLWDAWQARASQPVGVPDGWKLVPVSAAREQKNSVCMHPDLAAVLYSNMVKAAPAAPTVKAEQLDMAMEPGTLLYAQAPSLPAAGSAGKYSDVLRPFFAMMEAELHANSGKGDRPGWLAMSPEQCLLEIYYHTAKLQKAVKNNDMPGVREYTADVANMSMMLADICGWLDIVSAEIAAQQAGAVSAPEGWRSVIAMILQALDRDAAEGKAARGEMAAELRALLSGAREGGV